MSDTEKQSEAAADKDIRGPHPKVPAVWAEELALHRAEARRISVRFLRMKGSTTHDVGDVLVRLDGDTDRFRLEHLDDDGTAVEETHSLSGRQVIDHMWAWVCEEGLEYASKNRLTKLRGELAIYDERNICLNDSSVSRKVLNLEDPSRPYTDDDDNDLDAGIRGELAYERRVNREHTKRFVGLVERIESRAHASMLADAQRAEASRMIDERSLLFTQAKEAWCDKVMEQALGDARVDQLLEFGIATFTPKMPQVIDAFCVLMRSYGAKVDPSQVAACPDELMLWALDTCGAAVFSGMSALAIAARAHAPGSDAYKGANVELLAWWSGNIMEPFGRQLPAELAAKASAWGLDACKLLGLNPHDFTHLCFADRAWADRPGSD